MKAGTTFTLVSAAFLFNPNPARSAQFSGPYDPSNWMLDNSNADGFVDLTQIPIALELVGGNNGSRLPGETAYTTIAVSSGRVDFAWNYLNPDSAFWDRFGFLLNGTFEQITSTSSGSLPQSGTFSAAVRAGDRFGFALNTLDNDFGAARVTISDFSGPIASNSIPEPASVVGLLTFSILGMGALCDRTQSE